MLPTGFLLLLFGPVFFLGAAIVYFALSFAQDVTSKSILRIFAAVGAIVILSAVMYPYHRMAVLLVGGNAAYIGVLAGWYTGSIARGA
jgi:ABC-type enterochelin transport system permease subunit